MENKEERIYQLASTIFTKKVLPGFVNDTNESYHKDLAINAIMTAKLFVAEYEKDHLANLKVFIPYGTNPPEDEL